MKTSAVAVVGAGSWGTALAMALARANTPVLLWSHRLEQRQELQLLRSNERYLPGIALPELIQFPENLAEFGAQAEDLLIAVPSHAFHQTIESLKPLAGTIKSLAWATKGLEPDSHRLLHQVVEDLLPGIDDLAAISGPSFAKEVALNLPTAITVASPSTEYAQLWAARLASARFRVYCSDDIVGVETGGAVKNVLAIAAGISDGLGFGANARAALLTRGLAEMKRLGMSLGAQADTFSGLTGMGDLILTCTDDQSRNRRAGLGLASGKPLQQVLQDIDQVVEGVRTVKEVLALAADLKVDMPISQQVYRVLFENLSPRQAVQNLFSRELKQEAQ